MEYNYIEIGERIRKEREKLNLSQDELLDKIRDSGNPCIGRNTLSKLENGDQAAFNAISISKLTSICNVFDCSISYLMGEYTFRNYDNKFICEQTNLLESNLIKILNKENHFLNMLIGSNYFYGLDYYFHQMEQNIAHSNRCVSALPKLEAKAKTLEKDSEEYKETEKLYFNTISASERFEAEMNYSIYNMGINFGNLLEEYKENHTKSYELEKGTV